jgi:hypothetical protein
MNSGPTKNSILGTVHILIMVYSHFVLNRFFYKFSKKFEAFLERSFFEAVQLIVTVKPHQGGPCS